MDNEKYKCMMELINIKDALKAIKDRLESIPNVSKKLTDAELNILTAADLIKKNGDPYGDGTKL